MKGFNIGQRAVKTSQLGAFLPTVSFANETLKLGKKYYDCMFYNPLIMPWLLARVQLATIVLAKEAAGITQSKIETINAYQQTLLDKWPYYAGEYGTLEAVKNKQRELVITGSIDRTPTGSHSPFVTCHYNSHGQISGAQVIHRNSSMTTSYYSTINSNIQHPMYGAYKESRVLLQLKSWPLQTERLDLLFKLEQYVKGNALPHYAAADLQALLGYTPLAALECVERELRAQDFTDA